MTSETLARHIKAVCLELWPEKIRALLEEHPTIIRDSVAFPKEFRFGDFTTNIGMQVANRVNDNPLTIAELIIERLTPRVESTFTKVEAYPPGYVNLSYAKTWLNRHTGVILREKEKYGRSTIGKNEKVMVEFISANPTGPLTLGNGRGGFFGDVLANVLRATGHRVRKEYYVNDVGRQVDILAESVTRRYLQHKGINVSYPEECYQGEYVKELAQGITLDDATLGNISNLKSSTKKKVLETQLKQIREVIKEKLNIHFDYWFHESSLYDRRKKTDKAVELLKKRDLVYLDDGALWFKSEELGDEKDRVLIKKDGESTYFLSDVAYHINKFIDRKFERVIDVWGADHHGYVQRLKLAMRSLGVDAPLDIVIMQLVRLMVDGKEVKMSKRSGTFVTLEELVDEVGLDVARFFFLMRSPNTHMDFDLNLAKDTSEKNPVYYVQYAHARIVNIIAHIAKYEKSWKPTTSVSMSHQLEVDLARRLSQYPELLIDITMSYDVHRLPFYAIELADAFHAFYNELRVVENDKVDKSRANLAYATKIVLANALKIMGVYAPERMDKKE